ncbi:MAG: LysM domain-containing protein [Zetaproteobacteria bacterium]|nr:MAG: LysM domain-containing protein [Zetaproteobacteria bacterium]
MSRWLLLTLLLLVAPVMCQAAERHAEQALKEPTPGPYIVQPGDTLWDIAAHFFKRPEAWLRIWERNPYITNPDLIYPGNTIVFDAAMGARGGLRVVRAKPLMVARPVQRLEPVVDARLALKALERFDFIALDALDGAGYVLDGVDGRLNYGAHDQVYVRLRQARPGQRRFDVFRATDKVIDPRNGKVLGVLVVHRGQIELRDQGGVGVHRAVVRKAFREIARGDRLKPARALPPSIVARAPDRAYRGVVLFIRDDAAEAGQNQVVGLSLSARDGLRPGTRLRIMRAGGMRRDPVDGGAVRLPDEQIGEVLVLAVQRAGAMALVTRSRKAIRVGDQVLGRPERVDARDGGA